MGYVIRDRIIKVCRIRSLSCVLHSAKRTFDECQCKHTQKSGLLWEFWKSTLPSVFAPTLGKAGAFAKCLHNDTRKRLMPLPSVYPSRHSANTPSTSPRRPSTFFLARANTTLGKVFAECPTKNTRQRAIYRARVSYAEGGTRQNFC